jgi:hypothetical protein
MYNRLYGVNKVWRQKTWHGLDHDLFQFFASSKIFNRFSEEKKSDNVVVAQCYNQKGGGSSYF